VGSGYNSSPVAADGKIHLSNEDGEMLVIEAGAAFKHIAMNSVGESLMATPALSQGVMYIRGWRTLFVFGRKFGKKMSVRQCSCATRTRSHTAHGSAHQVARREPACQWPV
jgi:hypothetical protein